MNVTYNDGTTGNLTAASLAAFACVASFCFRSTGLFQQQRQSYLSSEHRTAGGNNRHGGQLLCYCNAPARIPLLPCFEHEMVGGLGIAASIRNAQRFLPFRDSDRRRHQHWTARGGGKIAHG